MIMPAELHCLFFLTKGAGDKNGTMVDRGYRNLQFLL